MDSKKSNESAAISDDSKKILKDFAICVIENEQPLSESQDQFYDALIEEKSVIIIKDPKLRTRTAIQIALGDCVHHVVLVAAVGSIICSSGVHRNLYSFGKPLAIMSALTNFGYFTMWKRSALSNYRVATGPSVCSILKNDPQPDTILVRRVENSPQVVHTAMSVAAVAIAFWKDISGFGRNVIRSFWKTEDGEASASSEPPANGDTPSDATLGKAVKEAFKRRELDHMQI